MHISIDITGLDSVDTTIEVTVESYEKFLADEAKASTEYAGATCFVAGCTNPPPYYKVGDANYWCGMCEEHANMRDRYRNYIQSKLEMALLTGLAQVKVRNTGGTELKAKLENVDAGMENRKLKRALWLARWRYLRNFSVLSYF